MTTLNEGDTILGSEAMYEVFEAVFNQFTAMAEWLLENKFFLIGLVIFVIGACIGLVKRVKG